EINQLARTIGDLARKVQQGAAFEPLALAGQQLGALAKPNADPFDDTAFWIHALAGAIAQVPAQPGPRHEMEAALRGLARRASLLADAMRFEFLYDRRRRMFTIGYRLGDTDGPGRADGAFYDLLAAEARLASFVAIAKGDVPHQHWFHLGRLVTNIDGRATL